jgi:glycosyltransferase involved in cell wall biosynthesis
MRIMHVTTIPMTLGFFRGQVGYLKNHGVDVVVVSSPGAQLDRFAAAEDVPAVAVPMTRSVTPLADVVSFFRLLRAVVGLKPDIVHSHTPKAALLGTLAARLTVRKAVLSVFGLPQMTLGGRARVLLDAKTRLECALAHRVWCDSFSMREYLIAHRLCSPHKLVVLGAGSVNGVDAAGRFNPARCSADDRRRIRRRLGIPPNALVVGFVGRIVGDKGVRELALAWSALRGRYPALHLLLVGGAEETRPIDAATASIRERDDRVHLTGEQEDVTPNSAFRDVFVLPSYREGFGMTNVEAAAFRLPVISTSIPGCVDSVADGRTGTLVAARDADALARAIAIYLEDPGLRVAHGEAGRLRVIEQFGQRRIWTELTALYRSILPASSNGGPR